jgi:hypothetical protein
VLLASLACAALHAGSGDFAFLPSAAVFHSPRAAGALLRIRLDLLFDIQHYVQLALFDMYSLQCNNSTGASQ